MDRNWQFEQVAGEKRVALEKKREEKVMGMMKIQMNKKFSRRRKRKGNSQRSKNNSSKRRMTKKMNKKIRRLSKTGFRWKLN